MGENQLGLAGGRTTMAVVGGHYASIVAAVALKRWRKDKLLQLPVLDPCLN